MINELFERELRNTSINNVSLADYIKENYIAKKSGKWIKMPLIEAGQTYSHECSLCGRRILITNVGLSEFPYCHCGAKMVEPQESEEISERNMKMWEGIFKAESEE